MTSVCSNESEDDGCVSVFVQYRVVVPKLGCVSDLFSALSKLCGMAPENVSVEPCLKTLCLVGGKPSSLSALLWRRWV